MDNLDGALSYREQVAVMVGNSYALNDGKVIFTVLGAVDHTEHTTGVRMVEVISERTGNQMNVTLGRVQGGREATEEELREARIEWYSGPRG